jgi:hypothetical protein
MSKFDLGSGGPEWCFVEARTGKQPASRHVRPLSKSTQHLSSLREFCCDLGPTSALHISHRNTLVSACASLQPSMVMCARRRNVSDYSNIQFSCQRWITDYHNPRLSPLRLPLRLHPSPRRRPRRIPRTTRKRRNLQCRCPSRTHSTRATRSCPLRISTPDATATVWAPRTLPWVRSMKELGVHSHKHQVRAASLYLDREGVW